MRTASITLLMLIAGTPYGGFDQVRGASISTIAFAGQTAPDGNGAISSFARPTIAADGSVAWVSRFSGTSGDFDDSGILHYTCSKLSFAVRENDPSVTAAGAPDLNGFFDDLRHAQFQLGPHGELAFPSDLRQTIGGGYDNSGLYHYDGEQLRRVARENDISPSGNSRFDHFDTNVLNPGQLDVGGNGSVIFYQQLRDLNNNRYFQQSIHRWDDGVLSPVALEGTPPATGDGTLRRLGSVFIDREQRSMHYAEVNNSSASQRIYRENALIAAVGQIPSGGGQPIGEMNGLLYSQAGSVALDVELDNAFGPDAVVIANGSSLKLLAKEDTSPPEGNGQFTNQFDLIAINDRDEVLFQAVNDGTTYGNVDNEGLYLGSASSLISVARENDLVPAGNGRFDFGSLRSPTALLSNSGSVAFTADLRNTPGGIVDNKGLYVLDGTLQKVVREADTLAATGEFITEVGDFFAIDDAGRVTFLAQLSASSPGDNNGDWGLFSYDHGEINELLREGDVVDGRQVQSITSTQANQSGEVLMSVMAPGGIESLLLISTDTASAGDYDGNGLVGQGDLDLVLLNWGSTAPPVPDCWVNEKPSGLIGQTALDRVLLNWGSTANGASITAVPEPTTIALGGSGLMIGLLAARRRS